MITITADHLTLLAYLRFDWDDECEWGAVSTDPKRPFGDSDVPGDISDILGRHVDHDEARKLTIELAAIVQEAVSAAVTHPAEAGIEPGTTVTPDRRARLLLDGTR